MDVTVLGAGIFGLSVTWACQQRGAHVRVIDPHGIGAGSSGGIVGALAPHTPENWNEKKQFQFESLTMAEEFWSEVEAASGQSPGYARLGRLQPIPDTRALELAQSRARSAADLWQGKAVWQIEEAGHRAGWEPQSPTGALIYDTLSARMHPRRAVHALASAIENAGGEILIGEAPLKGLVVHATGYEGLLEIAQDLDQPVGNGVKGQALLLDHDARDMPQLFADSLHIVPHADGTVAVGSTSERLWTDAISTDAQLDAVHQRAIAAFPILRDATVLERWAGVRPRAKSRAPMLGHHPVHKGAFIANGGFKIGFGMAPKAGEVMADLILEGRDAIPPGFRPEASIKPR
ncbi:MAG: FAD-binding oxidoreductase [Litoreibacter sp.]|nr:FAD-binding oxidoreductase [Litoreibacter sp.]